MPTIVSVTLAEPVCEFVAAEASTYGYITATAGCELVPRGAACVISTAAIVASVPTLIAHPTHPSSLDQRRARSEPTWSSS